MPLSRRLLSAWQLNMRHELVRSVVVMHCSSQDNIQVRYLHFSAWRGMLAVLQSCNHLSFSAARARSSTCGGRTVSAAGAAVRRKYCFSRAVLVPKAEPRRCLAATSVSACGCRLRRSGVCADAYQDQAALRQTGDQAAITACM